MCLSVHERNTTKLCSSDDMGVDFMASVVKRDMAGCFSVSEFSSDIVDIDLDGFVNSEEELCVQTQCAHVINATKV